MSIYYINPKITVNDLNFKEIMDNITNDISKLFIYNRNLIDQNNYNYAIYQIIDVISKFLKIYNFFDYDIKNMCVQIYNLNIEVIINIQMILYKTFYIYNNSKWDTFYTGNETLKPIVYYNLDSTQKQELRLSLLNGNFYMYDNIKLELPLNEGIILKKKSCLCETKNINNYNTNYIITVYW